MRFFYLIFWPFLFFGCAPYYQAPPDTGQTVQNPSLPSPAPLPTPQQISEWGVIKCSQNPQDQQKDNFNKGIRNFLSSSIDTQTIRRPVDCSGKHPGGVFIRGKVSFVDQRQFDVYQAQTLSVNDNSYLEIHIVDVDQHTLASLRLNSVRYAGEVNGNRASLIFQDGGGTVTLNGYIQNNGILTGHVSFENSRDFRGNVTSLRGSLGLFSIPACALFDCSNVTRL